jgi:trigger factor
MASFSVEEVSPIERRISVEVSPEQVRSELDQAYKHLSQRVRIPGFRPGKVPRRILEARFKEQVEADVVQHLVEHSYREALGANPEVHPVAPPRVTNEELKPGEPFRYQARVDVKPKVEPKQYEGLPLKKSDTTISDERVEEEIEKLRQAMAVIKPIEGRTTAEQGDLATIDFEGTIDGKTFPGGTSEKVTAQIEDGAFIDGKVPALAGASIGESRDVEYTFPSDYRMAELAGKTAVFKVTLKELKQKDVPALDDALAKEVGAGETVDDLRSRIRKELTEQARNKAEREERDQLIKGLIERNPFEVPQAMIERAIDAMIENALQGLARQGIDPRRMQANFDRMRDSFRDQATTEVKGALLLEAIALKENIEAAQEDLDARIKELAEQLQTPEEQLRTWLMSSEEASNLKFRIREEKTLAFLASKANTSES